ncbi:CBS domain-containing protein [Bosea sp. F3-2]|uniref:CBS domain-containing protein n=1 Tax=Bosea sp. F3-2 TaxID=2599640 RepID=UPI0011EC0D90|nr:CBS domain-containing protein [Bosea sp. F3-2]QEL25877.1 CBS domain-containing protein [Bosea sp. F3-2]
MQVSEVMTREVCVANPQETIQQAARLMAGLDVGVLPVGDDERLVGMITDRDIAIRGVAEGKAPLTKVSEVMSNEVRYCFADQEIAEVLQNMGDIQLRRLPVVDRDKRLVGILALSDAVAAVANGAAGEALAGISRPGGLHSQTG